MSQINPNKSFCMMMKAIKVRLSFGLRVILITQINILPYDGQEMCQNMKSVLWFIALKFVQTNESFNM